MRFGRALGCGEVVDAGVGGVYAGGHGIQLPIRRAVEVSRDRWFLDRISTHILACEGGSQARLFLGNWSDYEEDYKNRYGRDVKPTRVKYRTLKR